MPRLRIGWFATGRGQGSRNLLTGIVEAIRRGELAAEIAFVFCNRERGQYEATDVFLDLVEGYGIPLVTLSSGRFRGRYNGDHTVPGQPLPEWRLAFDGEVMRLLEPY